MFLVVSVTWITVNISHRDQSKMSNEQKVYAPTHAGRHRLNSNFVFPISALGMLKLDLGKWVMRTFPHQNQNLIASFLVKIKHVHGITQKSVIIYAFCHTTRAEMAYRYFAMQRNGISVPRCNCLKCMRRSVWRTNFDNGWHEHVSNIPDKTEMPILVSQVSLDLRGLLPSSLYEATPLQYESDDGNDVENGDDQENPDEIIQAQRIPVLKMKMKKEGETLVWEAEIHWLNHKTKPNTTTTATALWHTIP